MGSVQMCIECEQCSYEFAMDDYNYRTGERLTFCPRCGYKKSYTYETDESGNFVMKTDLYEKDEKTIGYIPKGLYITMKMYPCSGRTDTVSPGL